MLFPDRDRVCTAAMLRIMSESHFNKNDGVLIFHDQVNLTKPA